MFDKKTAINALNTRKDRSAWNKGVTHYALELADNIPDGITASEAVKAAMLNGAASWQQYSYGGGAYIYDGDIAAALCSPSELRRCKDGERNPNSRETWLDVQARALHQAASPGGHERGRLRFRSMAFRHLTIYRCRNALSLRLGRHSGGGRELAAHNFTDAVCLVMCLNRIMQSIKKAAGHFVRQLFLQACVSVSAYS